MTTQGLVLAFEANFDGLVGLTHNYGGLSTGNLASAANATAVSRPKEGALQGLAKAKRLADAGLVQGLLPPHERQYYLRGGKSLDIRYVYLFFRQADNITNWRTARVDLYAR